MIAKQDPAVGRVGLWSKNKNSLVRITLFFSRKPTFGPAVFDLKPKKTADLGACPSITIIPIHLTAIRACPSIILSIIPCPSIIPILYKPVPIQEVIGLSWFLRRDLLSLTGGVVFSHPAGIRAKFDFTPDLFPLFAPYKGSAANDTWLGGQVGFLAHLRHPNTSTAIGVKSTG